MKAIKFILIYVLLLGGASLFAQQQSGILRGLTINVADGETVPFANIVVKDITGKVINGGASDINGLFTISPIEPGVYTVEASCMGFTIETFKNVGIKNGQTNTISVLFIEEMTTLEECVVIDKHPLIDRTCCRRWTAETICSYRCCRLRSDTNSSNPVLTSDSISMYPNPSSGELNIQSLDDLDMVTVTNMNGQTVTEIMMDNPTQISVNLQHLPPATYVVHFIKGGQRVSKLWILAH